MATAKQEEIAAALDKTDALIMQALAEEMDKPGASELGRLLHVKYHIAEAQALVEGARD